MKNTGAILVMVTCSSTREAGKIKKQLLGKKRSACVNILPGIKSFFWWKDKIDSCSEVLLLVKTKKNLLKEVITLVKRIHSYEVPEIIALPIIGGNKDYLNWIDESASPPER